MDQRVKTWCAIGVLACLVRLGVGLGTGGLAHPELFEYDALARSILAGRGFAINHLHIIYYSFVTPLHSWISTASYWLTGSIIPLMLTQIAAGSALAVIVAAIAQRLFGGWIAAAAAGLLAVLHPGLVIYNATKAHSLSFDALFFSLALLQAFRLAEKPSVRRALEFAAIVGLGTLSRGTIIIFGPIAAVWLIAVAARHSRRVVIRNLVIAALLTTAIIAPWTIRNSILHHRFVFLLTTDSEDFWRGNNPNATGHTYVDAEHIVLETLPPEELADLYRQPNETAQADWFAARSHAFIKAHPFPFLRLFLLKFFHFWWYAPQTGVKYPPTWFYLYMIYYLVALVLAGFGLWRIVRLGPPATHLGLLIGMFLLALSVLQSLYYVDGRHRWAVESMILVLSGGGIARLVNGLRQIAPGFVGKLMQGG